MIFNRILYFCCLLSTTICAQDFSLDSVVVLQNELPESSGLLYRDGVLITHNDSGDGPYLYELDTLTGAVGRVVYLSNATAIDWEDLAADDTFLYIGDFGNNLGARMNLVIYRVRWEDYWEYDTVTADRIQFRYEEQADFTPQVETTAFDAETLIATTDDLYLFTKNWSDIQKSKVYRIPKEPGDYTITTVDSIITPGLLTGLDYRIETQTLLFVGYNSGEAFVLELSEVDFNDFSAAATRHWALPLEGSSKTEAIAYRDDRYAYLTKERNSLGEAILYRLDTDFMTLVEEAVKEATISVFPNPVSNGRLNFQLQIPTGINVKAPLDLKLLDAQGRVVYEEALPTLNANTNSLQLDTKGLASGVYFYEIVAQRVLASGRVVVE